MEHSESFTAIAAALAAASVDFAAIKKNKTAKIKSARTNTEFAYSYATLDAILEAVRKPLAANGLVLVQSQVMVEVNEHRGNSVIVTRDEFMETRLIHSSGEWFSNQVPLLLPTEDLDPRGYGSAQTYARRYGITALLCIVADEDDDAEAHTRNVAQASRGGGTRRVGKPATDGQVRLILSRLERAGRTEADLCAALEVDAIATLSIDRVDEALKLIDDGLQAQGQAPNDVDGRPATTLTEAEKEARKKREHDEALEDEETLASMQFIRNNLNAKPEECADEWIKLGSALQTALWLAPSKGGWFTVAERKALGDAVSKRNQKRRSTSNPNN